MQSYGENLYTRIKLGILGKKIRFFLLTYFIFFLFLLTIILKKKKEIQYIYHSILNLK